MSRAALMGGNSTTTMMRTLFQDRRRSGRKVIGKRELSKDFGSLFTTKGQAQAHSELIMEACFYDTDEAEIHYVGIPRRAVSSGRPAVIRLRRSSTPSSASTASADRRIAAYDPPIRKEPRSAASRLDLHHGDTITVNTGGGKVKAVLNAYQGDPNDRANYRKTMSYNYTTQV